MKWLYYIALNLNLSLESISNNKNKKRVNMNIEQKINNLTKQIETLQGRYLLGFSGGADSVALFDLLVKNNINFDIAIIHYHTRAQADREVLWAECLAKTFNKKCFIAHAPCFKSDFEKKARDFRADFFKKIIKNYSYDALLLAHNLNDRLEWLLMQLGKGAGISTLLGFDNDQIIRPLQEVSKSDIYLYCKSLNLFYFEDISNSDTRFLRNFIRKNFSNAFLEQFESGVRQSLSFLNKDKKMLLDSIKPRVLRIQDYEIYRLPLYNFPKNNDCDLLIMHIDKIAKKFGILLSFKQKQEIKKTNFNAIAGKNLIICNNEKYIFVALNFSVEYMNDDEIFNDWCKVSRIPQKLRKIIYHFRKLHKLGMIGNDYFDLMNFF